MSGLTVGNVVDRSRYDVVIVGASPGGIFTALELSRKSNLSILIIDKGKDISHRSHVTKSLLTGWGGAGAFSDGKLNFSTDSGGWLKDYLGEEVLRSLLAEVDRVYLEFGASKVVFGTDTDAISEISRKAALASLKLVPFRSRHLGSDVCFQILQRMRKELEKKVNIKMETEVDHLTVQNNVIAGVETIDGEVIAAKYVVVSPGRGGADWLRQEAGRLGLSLTSNPVDIGVRVEVPSAVMEDLTKILYEPKFLYYSKSFDDSVRTFCVCPYGFVVPEYLDDVITVNGHSYARRKSENTNFALLVNTKFTQPFNDPIGYGKYIAKLANFLVGGVLVQRLVDLEEGRRSTWDRLAKSIVEPSLKEAQPGDLSFVLPGRYLSDIKEMLLALDRLAPGVYSKHTLLYGVEVKFYSSRLKLNSSLETEVRNLFAIGDGAGITRGLVQSSASGIVAAREILRRNRRDASVSS
jgi:uncharacterized FAD-dependent dehydrogenase